MAAPKAERCFGMKDIVVIFVQTRDVNLPTEQPQVAAETNRGGKLTVANDSAVMDLVYREPTASFVYI